MTQDTLNGLGNYYFAKAFPDGVIGHDSALAAKATSYYQQVLAIDPENTNALKRNGNNIL